MLGGKVSAWPSPETPVAMTLGPGEAVPSAQGYGPGSVSPHPRLPDSPEDLLEELPHDRAEEETLSNAKVRSLVFV